MPEAASSSSRDTRAPTASPTKPARNDACNAPSIDSRTVMFEKRRASWNERARPRRARRYGSARVTSRPPIAIMPASSGANPEIASSRVLFPAPFGPMMPTISPGASARSTPATGMIAPNRTRAPVTSSARSADTGYLRELQRVGGGFRLARARTTPDAREQPCDTVGTPRHHGDDADAGGGEDPVLHRRRQAEHLAQI